jgi:hypothetical protein
MYVICPMCRAGHALSVGGMKTIIAILAAAAVLAVAAPAGARPIDAYGPIPSDATTVSPAPSSSGAEMWVVIAAAALAFAAGAGAARLAPVMRPRAGAS